MINRMSIILFRKFVKNVIEKVVSSLYYKYYVLYCYCGVFLCYNLFIGYIWFLVER